MAYETIEQKLREGPDFEEVRICFRKKKEPCESQIEKNYRKQYEIYKEETLNEIAAFRVARSKWIKENRFRKSEMEVTDNAMFISDADRKRLAILKKLGIKQKKKILKHRTKLRPCSYFTVRKELSLNFALRRKNAKAILSDYNFAKRPSVLALMKHVQKKLRRKKKKKLRWLRKLGKLICREERKRRKEQRKLKKKMLKTKAQCGFLYCFHRMKIHCLKRKKRKMCRKLKKMASERAQREALDIEREVIGVTCKCKEGRFYRTRLGRSLGKCRIIKLQRRCLCHDEGYIKQKLKSSIVATVKPPYTTSRFLDRPRKVQLITSPELIDSGEGSCGTETVTFTEDVSGSSRDCDVKSSGESSSKESSVATWRAPVESLSRAFDPEEIRPYHVDSLTLLRNKKCFLKSIVCKPCVENPEFREILPPPAVFGKRSSPTGLYEELQVRDEEKKYPLESNASTTSLLISRLKVAKKVKMGRGHTTKTKEASVQDLGHGTEVAVTADKVHLASLDEKSTPKQKKKKRESWTSFKKPKKGFTLPGISEAHVKFNLN